MVNGKLCSAGNRVTWAQDTCFQSLAIRRPTWNYILFTFDCHWLRRLHSRSSSPSCSWRSWRHSHRGGCSQDSWWLHACPLLSWCSFYWQGLSFVVRIFIVSWLVFSTNWRKLLPKVLLFLSQFNLKHLGDLQKGYADTGLRRSRIYLLFIAPFTEILLRLWNCIIVKFHWDSNDRSASDVHQFDHRTYGHQSRPIDTCIHDKYRDTWIDILNIMKRYVMIRPLHRELFNLPDWFRWHLQSP